MTDFLVTDIDPDLGRRLQERAQRHRHSLSDEDKRLCSAKGYWTWSSTAGWDSEMFESLIPPEDRGDDLVFEYRAKSPNH